MPGPKLQIRQSLRVEVATRAGPREIEATVLKLGDDELTLTFADTTPIPPELPASPEITLKIWDKLGAHQGVARVLRYLPPPASALVLKPPRQYRTTQQRQYFRVATSLPLRVVIVSSSDARFTDLELHSVTSDISAGGFGFESSLSLARNDRLRATITFPRPGKGPPELVSLDARIVRAVHVRRPGADRVAIGCEFESLSQRDRDRLVQLLFDLQRTVR